MSISLKIFLVDLGSVKSSQYPTDMYIIDVCKDVRSRYNYGDGGLDHGLLFKAQGIWLASNRMLGHYDLKFGDIIEFRKKHRILKVKTMDGSVKNILVDESLPVKSIVDVICQRIGLTNSDEYSLAADDPTNDFDNDPKKDKKRKENDATKGWLIPEKALREQGMGEDDFVVLKKKFFVTDQNVDRSDPVQLVMMYAQAIKDIVTGKLPCTAEEAAQFAAISLQITYGNQDPAKHKPGFAKMKDIVPPEYARNKDVEKGAYKEHSILQGTSDLNAKFRYVQLVRSLKSYGTTFFTVIEPADKTKRKKAAPMLLGITKISVVRMEIETKDIISEWKLTQLRNWSATGKSFTLDLGDHDTKYYQVETKEGEEIARLLSGYVEILVKRRNQLNIRANEIGLEETAVIEDYIKPTITKNVAIVTNTSTANTAKNITRPQGALGTLAPDSSPKKPRKGAIAQDLEELEDQEMLLRLIKQGLDTLSGALREIHTPISLSMGNDAAAVQWRNDNAIINTENLAAHMAGVMASISALVFQATGEPKTMNYIIMGGSLTKMLFDVTNATQAIRTLSSLIADEQDQDDLVSAFKDLIDCVSGLLEAFKPVVMGQSELTLFHDMSEKAAQAGTALLIMTDRMDVTESQQQELVNAATEVSNALKIFLAGAKENMTLIKNPATKKIVQVSYDNSSKAAQSMLKVSSVLAGVISIPTARDQLIECAVGIRELVSLGESHFANLPESDLTTELKNAAWEAEQCLSFLVNKARNIESTLESEIHFYHDQLVDAADEVGKSIDSPHELFANAKNMAILGTRLTEVLKLLSVQTEIPGDKVNLENTAKNIADLMAKMVGLTREALADVDNEAKKDLLLNVVEGISRLVLIDCQSYVKTALVQDIIKSYKATISCCSGLIAIGRRSGISSKDRAKLQNINKFSKVITEKIPTSVRIILAARSDPHDFVSRFKIIESAKDFITPVENLIAGADEAATSMGDEAGKINLLTESARLDAELQGLISLLNAASLLLSDNNFYNIIQSIATNSNGNPEEGNSVTMDTAESTLTDQIQKLLEALSNVTKAFNGKNTNQVNTAIGQCVTEYQRIHSTIEMIDPSDQALKDELLYATAGIGKFLGGFTDKVSKGQVDSQSELKQLSSSTTQSINQFLNLLPRQKAMTEAMGTIRLLTEKLENERSTNISSSAKSPIVTSKEEEMDVQKQLFMAASELSAATQHLVSGSITDPVAVKVHIQTVERSYGRLIQASGGSKNGEVIDVVHSLGLEADFFLNSLQASFTSGTQSGNGNDMLVDAAKSVGTIVDGLLGIFANSNGGLDDLTKSLQLLNSAATLVSEVNLPRREACTYLDNQVFAKISQSEVAGRCKELSAVVKSDETGRFGGFSIALCSQLKSLVSRAMNGAHLMAAIEPTSIKAVASKLDQDLVAKAGIDMKASFAKVNAKATTQEEMFDETLKIAQIIAKLCGVCQTASKDKDIPENTRLNLEQLKAELMSSTTVLIPIIKNYAVSKSENDRARISPISSDILKYYDRLTAIAFSAEFAGQSLRPSSKALALQQPLIDLSNNSIQEARQLISALQSFKGSDSVSQNAAVEKIKSLVNTSGALIAAIMESSPALPEFTVSASTLKDSKTEISSFLKSIERGEELLDTGVEITSFNQALNAVGDVVSAAVVSSVNDSHSLVRLIEELPEKFDFVTKMAPGAVATANHDKQSELLFSIESLASQLHLFVLAAHQNLLDPNDINSFRVSSNSEDIQTLTAAICKNLIDSEKTDPAFAQASQVIETHISNFEKLVKEKDGGGPIPLGQLSEELISGKKGLLNSLGAAITEKNADDYGRIALDSAEISLQISNSIISLIKQAKQEDTKELLQNVAMGVNETCLKSVAALKQGSRKGDQEPIARAKLNQTLKELNLKFSVLEKMMQDIAAGVIACQHVSEVVSDVVVELETSLTFATAKQLNPVSKSDNFGLHKDALLLNAQLLTEIIKTFANANSLSQETLSTLVSGSADAMKDLKTKSILAATSLSSAEFSTQQELIQCTIDIGEAMKELIDATSSASGCSAENAKVYKLNPLIDNQFDAITKLLDVVKKMDDMSKRTYELYQNIINAMRVSMAEVQSEDPALGTALPEEVAEVANQLANSVASLLSQIGQKPEDTVSYLNAVRTDIHALCRAGKAVIANAPNDRGVATIDAVLQACMASVSLIELIQEGTENGQLLQQKPLMQGKVKVITTAVTKIVEVVSKLVPDGYVDPNDPNVIAERELLSAANAIEAAARKLAQLRPAEKPREANEELAFEEQIIEAAKAIAAASSALVRSATGVQREIVAKGKGKSEIVGEESMYFSDGTWSDGLVSAAKLVVGATSELCDSANSFVKGECDMENMEKVIVCAKNVSASTVQLLTSATVRSDPNSDVQMRLRSAGKAVTYATDQLVEASRNHRPENDDSQESTGIEGLSPYKAKVLEMEVQMRILKLEKELTASRAQLANIRKGRYVPETEQVTTVKKTEPLHDKSKKIDPADLFGKRSEGGAFRTAATKVINGFKIKDTVKGSTESLSTKKVQAPVMKKASAIFSEQSSAPTKILKIAAPQFPAPSIPAPPLKNGSDFAPKTADPAPNMQPNK